MKTYQDTDQMTELCLQCQETTTPRRMDFPTSPISPVILPLSISFLSNQEVQETPTVTEHKINLAIIEAVYMKRRQPTFDSVAEGLVLVAKRITEDD